MLKLMFHRATRSARTGSLLIAASFTVLFASPVHSSELDKFNPATTDPELFRIAVRHSERLKVPEKGVKMLVVMTDRKNGRVLKEKKVFLQKTTATADAAKLANSLNGKVSIYRIPDRQISKIRALQAKFLTLPETRRDEITGSLSIDVTGCKLDPDDTGQMLISTFLKSSEFSDYVALVTDYDLRNVPSGDLATNADPVRPCR
ncbi:hypothetical protein [Labrenzia sp. DG1229]|uniref:hypothetical protein n=1 Tax=Labrenzia sp. DG1229 TaxID=681847 RepID=UPI000491D006|nr:hypothetical protein [Labrenzia sp. DG1229]